MPKTPVCGHGAHVAVARRHIGWRFRCSFAGQAADTFTTRRKNKGRCSTGSRSCQHGLKQPGNLGLFPASSIWKPEIDQCCALPSLQCAESSPQRLHSAPMLRYEVSTPSCLPSQKIPCVLPHPSRRKSRVGADRAVCSRDCLGSPLYLVPDINAVVERNSTTATLYTMLDVYVRPRHKNEGPTAPPASHLQRNF